MARKARRPRAAGRSQIARPANSIRYRDDPARRYAELSEDRRQGSDPSELPRRRLRALAQRAQMPEEGPSIALAAVVGASNWVQLGPQAITNGQSLGAAARIFVTGRLTGIAVDPSSPSTIYVAAARGGVWKTIDGGDHWSPLCDNEASLAIGALAMAPSNPSVLYAGTGEGNLLRYQQVFTLSSAAATYQGAGVLKTTNGGASWVQQAPAALVGAAFFRIAVHPTDANVAWAATSAGLFRTIDGGANWVLVTAGLPAISPTVIAATDVAVDPVNPANVFAAFFGSGVFKSTNGTAANPTFAAQSLPLPGTQLPGRIALALSPSSPATVHALVAGGTGINLEAILGLYTTSGGAWSNTNLPVTGFGAQSSYNLNLAVDPMTPDTVYISELTLWKATRNTTTGIWSKTDLGQGLHADHHAFAFDPGNHLVIYDLSDGGIYKSTNGGATWSDAVNREICVTQFEFIDQHPSTDAVVLGGTQDNGTEMYRASQVFYHSDEGDGGCVAIDSADPRNMLHGYFSTFIARSTTGGEFGSANWQLISDTNAGAAPVRGQGVFYPPFALDPANTSTLVVGTDRLNFDTAQGLGGFPTANEVSLPGITGAAGAPERISALNFASSLLLYVGTTAGKVFRLERATATSPWTVRALHGGALPSRWIWDIAVLPTGPETLVVAFGTFGIQHVWQGVVPSTGVAAWTPRSGTGATALPDAPCNALQIDPVSGNYYVATDIGVFSSSNSGGAWSNFSQGLPNVAAYDLDLFAPSRLLRAATHGRGLWERRLDVSALPDVELYVRDHILHSGRQTPVNGVLAPFANPLQGVGVGDSLWVWQCADIKVDAVEGVPLAFQTATVGAVDYVFFESALAHRNPQRTRVNRAYVQVHNRGIQDAANVTVKLLYADATAGAPPLPADFWTAFPGDAAPNAWIPIGAAQTIPVVAPNAPVVLEWDWVPPAGAAQHSCLLAVVDSAADPIPPGAKVFDIWTLANAERRVGWKNVHVINALPGVPMVSPLLFQGTAGKRFSIRFAPAVAKGWQAGVVLPKVGVTSAAFEGVKRRTLSAKAKEILRAALGGAVTGYDLTGLVALSSNARGAAIGKLAMPKRGFRPVLLFQAGAAADPATTITVVQEEEGRVVGGSTYVLRVARP